MKSFSVEEINKILDGSLCGTTTHQITGPEQIEYAEPQHITFIGDKKYIKLWKNSKASVAIVNEDFNIDPIEDKALIKVKNADVAMVKVLELFTPELPAFDLDIHPTAVIHPTASVGKNTQIGAGCYIGMHVVLGDHVTLYPNTTILDHSTVGHHTLIWSGTVIRERCHIGNHCILQPNVTIGADGFGYYPDTNKPGLLKIPQIGNVIIGNHVEIGSSSCIDRGKFSATVIGDGTKIDNLVQIGHNTKIGRFCIIAGTTGIAGSVLVEDGVIIAGGVSIKDHTTIGSKATIGACSSVLLGDVEPGKTMLGYPAMEARNTLKQWSFLKNTVK